MKFPSQFKCLSAQVFDRGNIKIVPIRLEDSMKIMQWRNEQIFHLRQNKKLTTDEQDRYFLQTLAPLFSQDKPNQVLFSYIEDGECIGYGGLVHINWNDKHAEISFVMNTQLEAQDFEYHWTNFLNLIEEVAFSDLEFVKIFTYSYNVRPRLYIALQIAGYVQEAILPEHAIVNGKATDVLIHSKRNGAIPKLLPATFYDIHLFLDWANDPTVRENAVNPASIEAKSHFRWYIKKLLSSDCELFTYEINGKKVGQVRLDFNMEKNAWIIDYSVAREERGKRYGREIIRTLIESNRDRSYIAMVKKDNHASSKVFLANNFAECGLINIDGVELKEFVLTV